MTIGTQSYPFQQHYRARNLNPTEHIDETLAIVAAAGIEYWEPFAPASNEEADHLRERLAKHKVRVVSAYLNVRLHDPETWRAQVEYAVLLARRAAGLGARIIVTNPEPIKWGSPEDKSDAQLRHQGMALTELAHRMTAEGLRLAYHTHDPEMRQGAREFHHMMQTVPRELMGFYLDAHWVYRGCGNSMVALEDVFRLYGNRVEAMHLRQSRNHIWTEHLQDGDVDYTWIAKSLRDRDFDGPLVIEQAIEEGTPKTMSMEESQRRSAEWVRRVIA